MNKKIFAFVYMAVALGIWVTDDRVAALWYYIPAHALICALCVAAIWYRQEYAKQSADLKRRGIDPEKRR